ncbi:Crp/Fnr family transcriptional regulator [Rhodovarius crocodyli]|nr:Crp/Fnr family transcriptional regulator [Rhodovarius crocodyli]
MNSFGEPLRLLGWITGADAEQLDQLARERVADFAPREDIVSEGDPPQFMHAVLRGWLCHYKALPNGRRQITGFSLPGDICDERVFLIRQMDHSIAAVTNATVGLIDRHRLQDLMGRRPRLQQAMARQSYLRLSMQREWLVSVGQRGAIERLAHLLCELHLRLEAVGQAEPDSCEMPLTQSEIAEATGLSTVHVNRTLQELRAANLIVLRDRTLQIPDLRALREAAMFDPSYLRCGDKDVPGNG